jgi:glucose-fructose oxidoreductase
MAIRWTMDFPNGSRCEAITGFNHRADQFRVEGDKGWLHFKEKAFTYRGAVCETSRGPLSYPFASDSTLPEQRLR